MENQSKSSLNNDSGCMTTIKAYIDSSSNFKIDKELYNIEDWKIGKYLINKYKQRMISYEEIKAIIFDKIIFSLIGRQKFHNKDYLFLFYILFVRENYRVFVNDLCIKNYSKFLRKFFNSCMKSHLLDIYEIAGFIEFYLISLYQIITKSPNENNIKILLEKPKASLKNFDKEDIQFIKLLVKYCLALCNVMGYSHIYKIYYKYVFNYMEVIEDPIFRKIFKKQLNKLFLNRGIYSYGKKFVTYCFNSFLELFYISNSYEFSKCTSFYIYTILHYQPKYLRNEHNKNDLYNKGSPFFFLNMPILINILKDMNLEEEKLHILIIKLIESNQDNFNLFIDDNNKLRVAEFMLIDALNEKIILNHLSKIALIKPYFDNEKISNNINNNLNTNYFEYLFYDLCFDNFKEYYTKEEQNKKDNSDCPKLSQFISSQTQDYFSFNNSKARPEKDYVNLIINKFLNSKDYFIRKYLNINNAEFTEIENNQNLEKILSEKSIEELFLILDILYSFSRRFHEEKLIQDCILDIRKIIIIIIQKSFENNTFNCVIFDFIITADKKYLPDPSEFEIIKNNLMLLPGKSFHYFIRIYPLFIIYIINYFPKNNLDISQFYIILKAFINGYNKDGFRIVNEDLNDHTLHINYLNIIYFIIEQILTIYISVKKNTNNTETNKGLIQYLSYCLNCKKKLKNPLILSQNLIQCTNCGEILLYINTVLYSYLTSNINELQKFIDECAFTALTGITCNILNGFYSKYENRNINSMFCYSLYYKIMYEHFQFLNIIKLLVGGKIPFVVEPNNDINNKEGILEEKIKIFFEKYITEESKYPYKIIFTNLNKDMFESFNSFRKTIKHEVKLSKNKYII